MQSQQKAMLFWTVGLHVTHAFTLCPFRINVEFKLMGTGTPPDSDISMNTRIIQPR